MFSSPSGRTGAWFRTWGGSTWDLYTTVTPRPPQSVHIFVGYTYLLLRQDELEGFHQVLNDISLGVASQAVRDFVIQAYVRGAKVGNAGAHFCCARGLVTGYARRAPECPKEMRPRKRGVRGLDGSLLQASLQACVAFLVGGGWQFCARSVHCNVDAITRDRWNRVVTRRVSRKHNHSLKV